MDLRNYAMSKILSGEYLLKDKWITQNEDIKELATKLFPRSVEAFHILTPRQGEREKHRVLISGVKGTPYQDVRDERNTRVYVGGPGSMVGAALDGVLIQQNKNRGNVVYLNYDFQSSNFRSSAYYYHIRHSTALNDDPDFSIPTILWRAWKRGFQSRKKFLKEAMKLNFWRIDVTMQGMFGRGFAAAFATSAVMLGVVFHTLRNTGLERIGKVGQTDWARNKSYSKASTPILQYLETKAVTSQKPVHREDWRLLRGLQREGSRDSFGNALHLVYDKEESEIIRIKNEMFHKYDDIKSREIMSDELEHVMGGVCKGVHCGYLYAGDGYVASDTNIVLSNIVRETGNTWKEGVTVERIFVDSENVRGIEYRDRKKNQLEYLPCSSAMLSLGYTAKYKVDTHKWSFTSLKNNPVGYLTLAAGCSGYALIKGKIPAVGAQFSHWTELEYLLDEDISLCKMTSGGNFGSEHAQLSCALNLYQQTMNVFGERLVGILSMESCPRVVNGQNDVQFYRLANRFHVSSGLGGSGVTKMGANGALSVLLSNPHLSASSLIEDEPNLFSNVDLSMFVTDRRNHIRKLVC